MEMRDEEIIINPVRTRGALRLRRDDQSESAPEPAPREAVRTRGKKRATSPEQDRARTLSGLIQQLRGQVGDLPLTVLIHGWGSSAAEEFHRRLSPLTRRNDALWLIPSGQPWVSITPLEIEDAVVLDTGHDGGQHVYRNLIGDLVFFPASDETEIAQVSEWKQRANAIIADCRGSHCAEVLRTGDEALLMTYRWSGQDDLV